MSGWLIAFVGLVYFTVAIDQLIRRDNIPMAVIFAGYAFSNIGLYALAK